MPPVEKNEDNSITLKVPSNDEEKSKSEESQSKSPPSTPSKSGKGGKKKGIKGKDEIIDEMSEEDKILKEGLEVAVLRLQEQDTNLHKAALDHLALEIKTATSSMTSVPKPLKFLRPHYDSLKEVYQAWSHSHPMKKMMADIMSVLGKIDRLI
jgi:26S proteasome regulatory subunit N1